MEIVLAFVVGFIGATALMKLEFTHTNNSQSYHALAVRLGEIYDKYFDVMEHDDLVDIDTAKVRLAWGIPRQEHDLAALQRTVEYQKQVANTLRQDRTRLLAQLKELRKEMES